MIVVKFILSAKNAKLLNMISLRIIAIYMATFAVILFILL